MYIADKHLSGAGASEHNSNTRASDREQPRDNLPTVVTVVGPVPYRTMVFGDLAKTFVRWFYGGLISLPEERQIMSI